MEEYFAAILQCLTVALHGNTLQGNTAILSLLAQIEGPEQSNIVL